MAGFPTSFFLISAYSESLFALLVALVLLTVHNKKWTAAAVIACLASATRPIGIVLWPWLLYCYWRESDGKKTINPWLIFIPPLGLIIFSLYLWQTTGDPLAWLHQQSSYQRSWQNPLELMANYIYLLFYGGKYWLFHVGEITALIFSGWLLVRLFRQDLNLALLSLFLLTPALFTGILTSFPRFVIVVLPLFVALAQVNKPYLIYIYYAIALPLLVKGVGNFIVSRWVA